MSQHQQRIGADRRVHQRFEDLRASLVGLGESNSGIVLNISEGGMAILSTEDLDLNSLRNLRFQAPEFEHWMEINAEIAWISDSRKQAGIRFKGLSDTARTQLRAGISIATVRAKRAAQAKQTGATTEARHEVQEVTDSIPASFAAPATAESATPVTSESEHLPTEMNANSPVQEPVQETKEHEASLPSTVTEAAPDSRLPQAQQESKTEEKEILPEESKQDERTLPPLNSADTKPQKTSTFVPGIARSSPLTLQKSALAEMPSRSLLPDRAVKHPSDAYKAITNRTDISYRKWVAVGAVAILASLLAFLAGWILGDPSRMKLGH